MGLEFTDRYQALGMSYPDPKTVCRGQCEGTGLVPCTHKEGDARLKKLWVEAEARKPSNDGYHFVICPDCGGTGKRADTA